jgi:hypothetical protein
VFQAAKDWVRLGEFPSSALSILFLRYRQRPGRDYDVEYLQGRTGRLELSRRVRRCILCGNSPYNGLNLADGVGFRLCASEHSEGGGAN